MEIHLVWKTNTKGSLVEGFRGWVLPLINHNYIKGNI